MHDLNIKLHICVQNIVMEGTVSLIFFKHDRSFFYEMLKENMQKIIEKLPVF